MCVCELYVSGCVWVWMCERLRHCQNSHLSKGPWDLCSVSTSLFFCTHTHTNSPMHLACPSKQGKRPEFKLFRSLFIIYTTYSISNIWSRKNIHYSTTDQWIVCRRDCNFLQFSREVTIGFFFNAHQFTTVKSPVNQTCLLCVFLFFCFCFSFDRHDWNSWSLQTLKVALEIMTH